MDWIWTLNHAIEYMEQHLLEEFTCDDVAESCYVSSFHFQRTFRLLTGLTIGEYIRNRRLSLAGHELLHPQVKVIDIALKYGYESPESFCKAFKRFHGVTPAQACEEGATLKSFNRLVIKIKLEGGSIMNYKIVKKEPFDIVMKTKVFVDDTSSTEIPKFWTEYYEAGYGENVCGMMGICISSTDNKKEWKYGIGCPIVLAKNIPDGFERVTIPGGTWAIFKCVGSMPNAIQDMWERIYSEWLPQSNYELLQDYDIEYYTEGDNQSKDYVSEIWIPVKEK